MVHLNTNAALFTAYNASTKDDVAIKTLLKGMMDITTEPSPVLVAAVKALPAEELTALIAFSNIDTTVPDQLAAADAKGDATVIAKGLIVLKKLSDADAVPTADTFDTLYAEVVRDLKALPDKGAAVKDAVSTLPGNDAVRTAITAELTHVALSVGTTGAKGEVFGSDVAQVASPAIALDKVAVVSNGFSSPVNFAVKILGFVKDGSDFTLPGSTIKYTEDEVKKIAQAFLDKAQEFINKNDIAGLCSFFESGKITCLDNQTVSKLGDKPMAFRGWSKAFSPWLQSSEYFGDKTKTTGAMFQKLLSDIGTWDETKMGKPGFPDSFQYYDSYFVKTDIQAPQLQGTISQLPPADQKAFAQKMYDRYKDILPAGTFTPGAPPTINATLSDQAISILSQEILQYKYTPTGGAQTTLFEQIPKDKQPSEIIFSGAKPSTVGPEKYYKLLGATLAAVPAQAAPDVTKAAAGVMGDRFKDATVTSATIKPTDSEYAKLDFTGAREIAETNPKLEAIIFNDNGTDYALIRAKGVTDAPITAVKVPTTEGAKITIKVSENDLALTKTADGYNITKVATAAVVSDLAADKGRAVGDSLPPDGADPKKIEPANTEAIITALGRSNTATIANTGTTVALYADVAAAFTDPIPTVEVNGKPMQYAVLSSTDITTHSFLALRDKAGDAIQVIAFENLNAVTPNKFVVVGTDVVELKLNGTAIVAAAKYSKEDLDADIVKLGLSLPDGAENFTANATLFTDSAIQSFLTKLNAADVLAISSNQHPAFPLNPLQLGTVLIFILEKCKDKPAIMSLLVPALNKDAVVKAHLVAQDAAVLSKYNLAVEANALVYKAPLVAPGVAISERVDPAASALTIPLVASPQDLSSVSGTKDPRETIILTILAGKTSYVMTGDTSRTKEQNVTALLAMLNNGTQVASGWRYIKIGDYVVFQSNLAAGKSATGQRDYNVRIFKAGETMAAAGTTFSIDAAGGLIVGGKTPVTVTVPVVKAGADTTSNVRTPKSSVIPGATITVGPAIGYSLMPTVITIAGKAVPVAPQKPDAAGVLGTFSNAGSNYKVGYADGRGWFIDSATTVAAKTPATATVRRAVNSKVATADVSATVLATLPKRTGVVSSAAISLLDGTKCKVRYDGANVWTITELN